MEEEERLRGLIEREDLVQDMFKRRIKNSRVEEHKLHYDKLIKNSQRRQTLFGKQLKKLEDKK